MILTDRKIKAYGQNLVAPFAEDRVQAVGYDLTAKTFLLSSEQALSEVPLEPMASVFVQCEEEIALPADITATIQLRNSRIRQGLILTAPRYYPGHCTPVYFRVTNFSREAVRLAAGDGIATIIFERLEYPGDHPYDGKFQHETKFGGWLFQTLQFKEALVANASFLLSGKTV